MSLIKRLKRITRGRIEAFLDSVEDIETVLPQLAAEMADTVEQAGNAEAKALTAVKAVRRRVDEAAGREARLRRGAELALRAGDADLARQALAAQLQAEQALQPLQQELAAAESAFADARAARAQLQDQLEDLRARCRNLAARSRTIKLQRKQPPPAQAGRRLLDEVARMEERVASAEDEQSAQSEVHGLLGAGFDEERVRRLERDSEVERRLAELKARLEKGQ